MDRIDLRLDASTIRDLPGGAITVDGVGARTGLYTYHDDKGAPFVELVPPSTLFDSESLSSAEGASVEIRHGPGLVTADDYQERTNGAWVRAWDAGEGMMGVKLRISSARGIKFIRDAAAAGRSVELSPTYEVDVEDSPGRTELGSHDGIQRDRRYNAIALLGPNEARGGPGMRLAIDGPACAPAGCRVQFRRHTRADAREAREALEETMSKTTITTKDGRSVSVDARTAAALRAFKVDAAAVKRDAIETVNVTLKSEGEEDQIFDMPKVFIDQWLEGLGVSAAEPAAAPAGMEEEEIQGEGLDADDEGKSNMDALDAKIHLLVKRYVADAYRAEHAVQRRIDARDAEVVAAAGRLHVDANDGRPWHQIAADGIAKADLAKATLAKKLAKDAKDGDQVAEGRLRQMLADAADGAASSTEIVEGKTIERTALDAAAQPWGTHAPSKGEN
jgi:Fe-S cluster assembly iron-binding protein IscA